MKHFVRVVALLALGLGSLTAVPQAHATDSPVCNAGTNLCDQGEAYLNALKEANAYACYTTTGQLAQQNTHKGQAVLLPVDPNRYEARAECYREFDHLYSIYHLNTSFFPPAATCSARPAITVAPDSGPVCHEGCAYQAPSGQTAASPTGATCVPPEPLDPGKNCNDCQEELVGRVAVGDPVNMFTGVESETVIDFQAPTGHLGLARYYSSDPALPQLTGLGGAWRHSYLRSVQTVDAATVRVIRANGTNYLFRKAGSSWKPDWDVSQRLVELVTNGLTTGWVLTERDDSREIYDSNGRLTEIAYIDSDKLTLVYSAGKLQSVTDRQARAIAFTYAGDNIASVALPDGRSIQYAYDSSGRLASVGYQSTDGGSPQYDTQQYRYEDSRFPQALTSRLDEEGNVRASWEYDAQGRVTRSVHGSLSGAIDQVTLSYGSGTTTVTNALGESASHSSVVQLGRAKVAGSQKQCLGCGGSGLQSQTYDANGYADVSTDLLGVVTDEDYSPNGLLVRKTQAANDTTGMKRITETFWNQDFRAPNRRYVYNAAGNQVASYSWSYNSRGQVTAYSDDRTIRMTYCEQYDVDAQACPMVGLLYSLNGKRTDVNDETLYAYYPSDDASCATAPATCPHRKGDLWKVTNPLGQVTETLKYDAVGRVLSVKDPNGVVTDFEYHPRGWLTARKVRGTNNASETDDLITRIEYYSTGLVKKATLPDGSHTSFTYDAVQRLTDITDGEGNTVHYTLDNAGNRTKEDTRDSAGALVRTLSRVYNQLGQLQAAKDAYNNATTFAYDANGNTDTVTDPLSRVTDSDYDPLGRLSRTIQNVGGLNVTTQFQYDARDNVTAVIDPKGLTTGYTYNGLGDLTQLSSPDTGTTSYTYDSAGNLKTQTDARSVNTTYYYDSLNRLTSVVYPTSSLNVSYVYDSAAAACPSGETYAVGRLSRINDGSGSTQYCYDRFGNMVRKVQTTAGQSLTVRYAYTQVGQLGSITYPDGTIADYVRDAQGRATEIGVTRPGQVRTILLTAAGYYPFGPVAEWAFGNGRLFQRTFNQNYQPGIVQDQDAGGLSVGYEFDAVGNLAKLRNGNQDDPPLRLYGYDALNRLTSAQDGTTQAFAEQYSYDATGNRTGTIIGGITTGYTIASNSHRLSSIGSTARTYDNAGNTASIGGTAREFVYNDANRMSAVRQGGVTTMNYAYNGKGEQVRRVNGANDTLIVYDEAGHWLGEYDSAGTPKQQVVWLDDLPVGLVIGAVTANQPLHYIEADALRSPRVIVDAQRDVAVWAWPLTGEVFGSDLPLEDYDANGQTLSFGLRFAGQQTDVASGLNQNYYRDYDPTIGRYIQSDPVGLAAGPSTYGYVRGQPLTSVDPKGLIDLKIPGIGSVTIHANPGPEATDFRPEHDPPHVHLGSNDGPRVDVETFKPLSPEDARRMTKEQLKLCKTLTPGQKALIRARQAAAFKYGRYVLNIMAAPLGSGDSFTNACRSDPIACLDLLQETGLPAGRRQR